MEDISTVNLDEKITQLTARQDELQKSKGELLKDIEKIQSELRLAQSQFQYSGSSYDDFQVELEELERALSPIKQKGEKINDEFVKVCDELRKTSTELETLKREKDAKDAEIRKAELERQKREDAERKKAEAKAKVDAEFERLKNSPKFRRIVKALLDILKVQIVPSTECIELNDKFIKRLFNLNDDTNKFAMNGGRIGVIEKVYSKKSKKHKDNQKIVSRFKMKNEEGYDDETPLDEFDRAVLGIITSELACGNQYLTVGVIYRALTGKVGKADDGFYPEKNQRDAIINSVFRLMKKIVDFSGAVESLKEMKYIDENGDAINFKWTNLLSASIVDAKVNGQVMEDVIFIHENSPLYYIADAKDQIVRYPHELLDVPGQNNTPLIIAIKKYVMRRICEIKAHKQLTPTITFNDVFKKCRVENTTDRNEVKRRRNYILNFFEHLKEQNFIKNFEVVRRGNLVYAVKFSY